VLVLVPQTCDGANFKAILEHDLAALVGMSNLVCELMQHEDNMVVSS
jgi:hypothetical protein